MCIFYVILDMRIYIYTYHHACTSIYVYIYIHTHILYICTSYISVKVHINFVSDLHHQARSLIQVSAGAAMRPGDIGTRELGDGHSPCGQERRSFAQRVLKGVQGQLNEELLATNEEMHSVGLHLEAADGCGGWGVFLMGKGLESCWGCGLYLVNMG